MSSQTSQVGSRAAWGERLSDVLVAVMALALEALAVLVVGYLALSTSWDTDGLGNGEALPVLGVIALAAGLAAFGFFRARLPVAAWTQALAAAALVLFAVLAPFSDDDTRPSSPGLTDRSTQCHDDEKCRTGER
ncbi:hypothetical protein GCM10027168_71820 [Streptomyces capparidis]